MARTKQTARKMPPKESYKKRKDNNWQVEENSEPKKRKIVNLLNQIFPSDLIIITKSESNDESFSVAEHNQPSTPNLSIKLNEHVCSERCFAWLTKVNWTNYFKHDYPVPISFYDNIKDMTIFAPSPEQIDIDYAQHILKQVVSKQDEFSVSIFKVEMETDIDSDQIIQSVTYEYRTCGIKCYYTRAKDFAKEVVMIFIDTEKYLCFGHYYNFPYFTIPYVNHGKEEDNSINLCEEEFIQSITNPEGHQIETPILLPLSKVLENAQDFLAQLFDLEN
ncbi:predicted protein [Naegleria gruberi]|uniref:Predicted protein n=1 Tax=Naegleria gruberi TaxID=5762 RepID=D2VEL3_NAEGR|nr:uncharacterized protein NAEGRDRAFT_67317 [Naegleria gruberi]EFC44813.1 predicted protein [Naegleria gruberi]|eukprot:XP_002677557.1 predicted protein [Naegleria gruberi strain NEG-M]